MARSTGTRNSIPRLVYKSNYADAAAGENSISKKNAIIFDAIEDFVVSDYLSALGDVIGGDNIIVASRFSQRRIIFYLKTVQLVQKVCEEVKSIEVVNMNGKKRVVTARPLVNPAIRVVISNVKPDISNSYLDEALVQFGIKAKSKVTSISGGYGVIGYPHVLSLRRQFFIDISQKSKIPSVVNIIHDEIDDFVYFSFGNIKCFSCKQEGHIARVCSEPVNNNIPLPVSNNFEEEYPVLESNKKINKDENNTEIVNIGQVDDFENENGNEKENENEREGTAAINEHDNTEYNFASNIERIVTDKFDQAAISKNNDSNIAGFPPLKRSREPSSLSSSNSSNDSNIAQVDYKHESKDPKQVKRLRKALSAKEIKVQLKDCDSHFINCNPNGKDIDMVTFCKFLSESYGLHDIKPVVKKFSFDLDLLLKLLKDVADSLQKGNLYARIRRLAYKIENPDTALDKPTVNEVSSSEEDY